MKATKVTTSNNFPHLVGKVESVTIYNGKHDETPLRTLTYEDMMLAVSLIESDPHGIGRS